MTMCNVYVASQTTLQVMAKVDEKIWLEKSLFVAVDSNLWEPKGSCNTTNSLLKHSDQYLHLSHLYIFFVSVFEGSASFLSDYLGSKEFQVIVTMTVWKVSFWNNRKCCLQFASLWFLLFRDFKQTNYMYETIYSRCILGDDYGHKWSLISLQKLAKCKIFQLERKKNCFTLCVTMLHTV